MMMMLLFLLCVLLLLIGTTTTRAFAPPQLLHLRAASRPPHAFISRGRRSATRSQDNDHLVQKNAQEDVVPQEEDATVRLVDANGAATTAAPPQQQQKRSDSSTTTSIAVLLNRNARSVTDTTVQIAKEVFGPENVYASSTAEEAEQAARAVLHNPNIQLIIPMGGDGTLTTCINTMVAEQQRKMMRMPSSSSSSSSNRDARTTPQVAAAPPTVEEALAALPRIAYIPRGTGNGVGSVVACAPRLRGNRKLRQVLEQLRDTADASLLDTVELPLLQVQTAHQPDTLCFFAGGTYCRVVVPCTHTPMSNLLFYSTTMYTHSRF